MGIECPYSGTKCLFADTFTARNFMVQQETVLESSPDFFVAAAYPRSFVIPAKPVPAQEDNGNP